jgi:hypothetical protein
MEWRAKYDATLLILDRLPFSSFALGLLAGSYRLGLR